MGKCEAVQLTLREALAEKMRSLIEDGMRGQSDALHRAVEVRYDARQPAEAEERAELFYQALVELIRSPLAELFALLGVTTEAEGQEGEGGSGGELAF